MKVDLLNWTRNADKLVSAAAKTCYSKTPPSELFQECLETESEKINTYLSNIAKSGHLSTFEHASFTFGINEVSRSLLAQLTRHRIASFSVQSQRYVSMSEVNYIKPDLIKESPEAEELFDDFMKMTSTYYKSIKENLMDHLLYLKYRQFFSNEGIIDDYRLALRKYVFSKESETDNSKNIQDIRKQYSKAVSDIEKIANENARSILPNATATNIVMTMNARQLLHFFSLRCCNRAQSEIRELADKMLVLCKDKAPILFAKAGAPCEYGNCPEGRMSCGDRRTR